MTREGFDPAVVRDAYDAIALETVGGFSREHRRSLSGPNSLASGTNAA